MQITPFASRTTVDLKRVIYICGFANLVAFGLLVPLSYALAAVFPFDIRPNAEWPNDALLDLVKILGPIATTIMERFLSDSSILRRTPVRVLVYTLPMLLSTGASVFLLFTLRRRITSINESVVSLLFRMSLGFAVINLLAQPIFTRDFWVYIAQGRMILAGGNPYYQSLTSASLAGLPVGEYGLLMPYGPLWAIVSAGLAFLGQHNIALEFLFFKLILAVFWILSLVMVRKILIDASPAYQALAITIFGWLPVSFHQSIAEGHNDVVTAFFLLLWMWLMAHRWRLWSPFALVVSVLVKYTTLPLFAVDVLQAWQRRMFPWRRYLVALLLSALLALLVFAPFWKGPDLFTPLAEMRTWNFFTPASALDALVHWLNMPLPGIVTTNLFRVLFVSVVVYYGIQYFRVPDFSGLVELSLAILCAVLFAGVSHYLWPWYIIWILAPAAITVRSGLLRFVIPVAIFSPFLQVYYLVALDRVHLHYASVSFYTLVAVTMQFMPRAGWGAQGKADVSEPAEAIEVTRTS